MNKTWTIEFKAPAIHYASVLARTVEEACEKLRDGETEDVDASYIWHDDPLSIEILRVTQEVEENE